ncbi:MAG TPA: HD domain-containing phosphohydrolase [Polyangiaceae bacterium]|nr:HD domain-containing phosphohydrolase [Polyangiaceae bacterium]
MNRATASGRGGAAVLAMDRVEHLLAADARAGEHAVLRPHPLVVTASRPIEGQGNAKERLVVVFAPATAWDGAREILAPFDEPLAQGAALVVLVGRPADPALGEGTQRIAGVLDADLDPREVRVVTARAFELLEAKARADARGQWVNRYRYELGELIHIARAMTTVRDVDQLLGLILEKARFVTGADAGSIYIVEHASGGAHLRFKLTQNDSVKFDSREFTMPLSERSVAGCVALRKTTLNIADVYDLPPGSSYQFDSSFDRRTGYMTRSMLVAPLVSQRGEVIGVIQLINKKRDAAAKLVTTADVDRQVVSFDERSEELLGMLASQAGVSLETAMLYTEIRELFDGFVSASVEAIESRDPTTSGHSRRVAELTVALARTVSGETSGPFADATFTREDLRELEYASLLHDFGKIGVREKVLVKAKKLYPEQFDLLRGRFDYVARSVEADILARKVHLLETGAPRESIDALDRELARRKIEIEQAWESIEHANEPSVLSAGDFERIDAIARETFVDRLGNVRTLLDEAETASLKLNRGSLTTSEFDEIRSHVSHTFRFLSQIPWGKSLRRVPLIAGAHHERLNGTGYPNRLRAEEIPVQSKMMSIADIFDALTASDRPYKKAVPVVRAVDILEYGVRDGHLDGDLVRIFTEARVWELAAPLSRLTRVPAR